MNKKVTQMIAMALAVILIVAMISSMVLPFI